jgi:hypothetical protein
MCSSRSPAALLVYPPSVSEVTSDSDYISVPWPVFLWLHLSGWNSIYYVVEAYLLNTNGSQI